MGGIQHLIENWYLATGFFGIVFAMALESCLIPLPSEIVMPLAGYYVLTLPNRFAIGTTGPTGSLIAVAFAGALGCLIGSTVAYIIGASGGRSLLLRYGKYILISRRDADRADRWFARYGAPVAFFSRLLPVVRTYISLPAGISRMNFAQFAVLSFLGSLPWTFVLALLGYNLGSQFDKLSTAFHGADVVIGVLVLAGVGYYIYHHVTHQDEEPPVPSSEERRGVRVRR